ncbi:alpha/beta fold hydrolase [Terasakiella pusilla]|uniref:alpha/beta fold hydrolase n=1 Tax=Terasakiella pusilla TaxID=64973 RepID=UPI003AA80D82
MADLVFVHGWGFDKSFWQDVIAHLQDFTCHSLDLGFYGKPDMRLSTEAVYVTHSMGLCWLLDRKTDLKGLVSVNGFTKFCAADDFVEGVNPRVLKRMIRQFTKTPETVWSDFMKNSGLTDAVFAAEADVQAMADGLAYLETCDVHNQYSNLTCPKRALVGDADLIVPKKMSEASFAHDLICYKGGNHLLPLYQPKWVADQLRDFLDQTS